MEKLQSLFGGSPSCSESVQAIEEDMHHANTLAAAIYKAYGGARIQMRLSYSPFGHVLLFFMRWMGCACIYSIPNYLGLFHVVVHKVYLDRRRKMVSHERSASLREFYGFIYPSLEQLESMIIQYEGVEGKGDADLIQKMGSGGWWNRSNEDPDRESECGICLEVDTKMVLPNCHHEMCINCYRDWNVKSQSCPFCRNSLKRIASGDLWVLTSEADVMDTEKILEENLKRLHLLIDNLPLAVADSLFLMHNEYLL